MRPIKLKIYEKVNGMKKRGIYDDELMASLKKQGYDLSLSEFNRILLQMEIEGLITVRWVGKDKRIIRPYEAW